MTIKFDDERRAELAKNKLYTPKFVWLFFCLVEFFTFYDRGAVSGALQQIRQDAQISGGDGEVLSGTKAGLLSSVFITGFLIFSPIFTGLAGRFTIKTLLCVGMFLWVFSVILTGASPNYGVLVFARCVTGVGEAAFTPFFVTIIDNVAPRSARTLYLGCWYAQIACGTAIGMATGAIISSKVELPDGLPGWRLIFYLEAIFGGLFLVVLFFLPKEYEIYELANSSGDENAAVIGADDEDRDEDQEGIEQEEKAEQHHVSLWEAIKEICKIYDYTLIAVGYSANNFVSGALAAWLVQETSQSELKLTQTQGGIIIGGSMAFCGLVGSLAGGKIIDKYAPASHPNSVTRSMLFAAVCFAIAIPVACIALLAQKLWLFIATFVPGVFIIFSIVPAVTVALLGVVPPQLRPYSISISMIYQHLLGDAISPTIAGALSSQFSGECDSAGKEECNFMNFDNMTYSADHNWLDGECRWIKAVHKGDTPYCANTMQLNKALIVCVLVGALAVPLWLFVALKRQCCLTQEQKDEYAGKEKEYLKQKLITTNNNNNSTSSKKEHKEDKGEGDNLLNDDDGKVTREASMSTVKGNSSISNYGALNE